MIPGRDGQARLFHGEPYQPRTLTAASRQSNLIGALLAAGLPFRVQGAVLPANLESAVSAG
jgi:hypothetical protein